MNNMKRNLKKMTQLFKGWKYNIILNGGIFDYISISYVINTPMGTTVWWKVLYNWNEGKEIKGIKQLSIQLNQWQILFSLNQATDLYFSIYLEI